MKKLAIIGCGGIGTYHLGHLLGFKDIVDLVGFCDLIESKAQAFVQKAGCGKAFTDFRKMYDEVKPDMVFICVPPYCHGDIEYETIKRGIHFFVEKPLTLDLDMAYDIRDKVKAAGLITATGFQCRYSNLVEPNKEFIRNHQIVYVECARIGGIPGVEWWQDKVRSGGQIVEQTIHQFDIIRYVFDEPTEVFTYGTRNFISQPGFATDSVSTTAVKFASGALGSISTGCYAKNGNVFESKITFSARDCRADLAILGHFTTYGDVAKLEEAKDKPTAGLVLSNDGTMQTVSGNKIVYKQDGDAGILCDRTFIEAVISGDGSKIRSPYDDALKSLVFTMSCNQSMDSGLPVKIVYR